MARSLPGPTITPRPAPSPTPVRNGPPTPTERLSVADPGMTSGSVCARTALGLGRWRAVGCRLDGVRELGQARAHELHGAHREHRGLARVLRRRQTGALDDRPLVEPVADVNLGERTALVAADANGERRDGMELAARGLDLGVCVAAGVRHGHVEPRGLKLALDARRRFDGRVVRATGASTTTVLAPSAAYAPPPTVIAATRHRPPRPRAIEARLMASAEPCGRTRRRDRRGSVRGTPTRPASRRRGHGASARGEACAREPARHTSPRGSRADTSRSRRARRRPGPSPPPDRPKANEASCACADPATRLRSAPHAGNIGASRVPCDIAGGEVRAGHLREAASSRWPGLVDDALEVAARKLQRAMRPVPRDDLQPTPNRRALRATS